MILMNDFKAEPAELKQAQKAAAARVIDSGWYVLGKEGEAFEAAWAKACGVEACAGVGNGMDAIELALRALGLGPGDEVITTPMTAFATVLAIVRAGAEPVLADIDPQSGLLDPLSVQRCIGPRTRAVLLVHLYGQVRRMDEWAAQCAQAGIALVEDCAQAHLARWRGRSAGTFGVAGAWSFYPTKNLGALGDGGAFTSTSRELVQKVTCLRNYGQSERYHHPVLGMNSRLDEMQAALLGERIRWLPGFTQRRREVAQRYDAEIRHPGVKALAVPEDPEAHVHHLYVLRCEARKALMDHLRSCGVQSLIHYPVPVHRQPPCASLRRDPAGLPHAEAHADTCLSIPCHPQMSDDDVGAVIAAVNAFDGR